MAKLGGPIFTYRWIWPPRSRVVIPPAIVAEWAHVIARIDDPLHFIPRIGGRPLWGWVSVSNVALAAVVTVCRWWSLGGIYLLVVGRGPHRSKVAIPPPIFVARAHAIVQIDSTRQFAPRIGGRPTLG